MAKDKTEIATERSYLVVKSNRLIQRSRYELSAMESKLILYLISKIKPEDTDFQSYTFNVRDLCEVCGITTNGKNYRDFRAGIDSLRRKTFWIETDEELLSCSWLTDCRISKRDNTVTVQLDYKLKPYLLQLRESFSAYQLENILVMKSKYGIRLYELLLSYIHMEEYKVELSYLRELLGIKPEEYPIYNNFKVRVLDTAMKEINRFTELEVSYQPIRESRKITALNFKIQRKSDFDAVRAMIARGTALEKGE